MICKTFLFLFLQHSVAVKMSYKENGITIVCIFYHRSQNLLLQLAICQETIISYVESQQSSYEKI